MDPTGLVDLEGSLDLMKLFISTLDLKWAHYQVLDWPGSLNPTGSLDPRFVGPVGLLEIDSTGPFTH